MKTIVFFALISITALIQANRGRRGATSAELDKDVVNAAVNMIKTGSNGSKKMIRLVIELVSQLLGAGDGDYTQSQELDIEAFEAIVEEARNVVRDDETPVNWDALESVIEDLIKLLRTRGAQDRDIRAYISLLDSIREQFSK